MKNKNLLHVPLLILSALFILLILGGTLFKINFSDYCINLSIEVLGAIVTIICIDFYLNKHEKIIQNKRENTALKILAPIIRRNLHLLFVMYKASALKRGRNYKTSELIEFLNPKDYFDNVKYLDIYADSPIHPPIPWWKYLQGEFSSLYKEYDTLLDKYSNTLNPDLVDEIENVKNSLFHSVLTNAIPLANNFINSTGNQWDNNKSILEVLLSNEIETYFLSLQKAITITKYHDSFIEFYKISDEEWRDDMSPKIGLSRLN